MRRLLALVAVATAVAMSAPAAQAKPFSYSDPKDSPVDPGVDIVSVTYATEGETYVTKVRGKRVKTYEPKTLVVTMTLAGAPLQQEGIKYRVESEVSECGPMRFTYAPYLTEAALGSSMLMVGCGGAAGPTGGDSLFIDPKFTVKGNKLIWSIGLKALPKQARAGAILFALKSSVDVAEPALGTLGPDDFGDGLLDVASSDDGWEIS